jgi:hypothetical protein
VAQVAASHTGRYLWDAGDRPLNAYATGAHLREIRQSSAKIRNAPAEISDAVAKIAALVLLASTAASAGQQAKFEDVVRNLRNPDPKTRLQAVRLLRRSTSKPSRRWRRSC